MTDRVRWIRTYVGTEPGGPTGTFCIDWDKECASIREHATCVFIPGKESRPLPTTGGAQDDPAAVAPAVASDLPDGGHMP